MFLGMKKNRCTQSTENYEDHMNSLLITEGENWHYVLIKDFNRLMYNQTKH